MLLNDYQQVPIQDLTHSDYLLKIAHKYNLLISEGTDYHGKSVKPDIELATGIKGNIRIRSLSILNHIKTK